MTIAVWIQTLCCSLANSAALRPALPDRHFDIMLRIEGYRFGKPETMLFEHARCGHAGIACGEDRPSAGKSDPMRARQVKAVKADHEEEIEHHLAAADGDAAAVRQ